MRGGLRAFEDRSVVKYCILLAVLLAVGIAVFDDYGIAWDERVQRQYGEEVYAYVTEGDKTLLTDRHRYYGPVFEFALIGLERVLDLSDTRDIYLMRHLVTFLVFWIGLVFFFLLCLKLFDRPVMAGLGVIFLVLSPRIFAHAFYNSKDIPFMTLFIIGVFTLLMYLDHRGPRSAAVHGLACALLVDVRIVGTMLVGLTLLFHGFEVFRHRKSPGEPKRSLASLALYLAVLAGVTVLFWPTLWRDPLVNFIRVFEGMRNFPWEATVLYRGNHIWSTELPWHYIPVWIGITTPAGIVIAFFAGVAFSGWALLRNRSITPVSRRNLALVLCWLLVPVVYSILSGAVLYDAWRHSFFIYPAMVLVTLTVIEWLMRRRARIWGLASGIAFVIVGLSLSLTLGFMINNHPHQNVYFNRFVGGTWGAYKNFEMDYWGLSYRQGLEYIIGQDPGGRIPVHAATAAGRYNADILRPEDRERLAFVSEPHKAEYHITHFRWEKFGKHRGEELYAVRVDKAPIMAVYRVR